MFNWRVIALQYHIGFCYKTTWTSHRYTYVPSLLVLPPPQPPSVLSRGPPLSRTPPSVLSRAPCRPCAVPWLLTGCLRLALHVYQRCALSPSRPLLLHLRPQSALCVSLLPCRWVHQCHFSRFYACALIYKIYFSLSDLLSVTVSRFIFYEFGQIYNDTYLSFRVQGIFRALKILYTIKYLLKTKLTFISSSPKISFHWGKFQIS